MLRFSGAGVSDVGLVRPHNEDSAFVGPYVAVVADGVGGAAAGEVASATAAYVVAATALARFGDDPDDDPGARRRGGPRRACGTASSATWTATRDGHDADRGGLRRHPGRARRTSATPAPTCCATAR